MPDARKDGKRQHNFWLEDKLWDAAKKRAAERGETISEVVRRSLVTYNKPRKGEQ